MLKLGTQDKDFFPKDAKGKFEAAKSLGFDCFEIDGRFLVEKFQEVKSASKITGFPVLSVCGGYTGWIGDFDAGRRKTALCDIERILEKGSEVGASGIVVPAAWGMFSKRLPPMVPPRSDAEDHAILLDSLGFLDNVAARTGTFIHFEPLNRYEDHMVNTLEDAISLIDSGRFVRTKVMPDLFHMNIEENDIGCSLRKAAGRFTQIHLASSKRYQPGTGHLDYEEAFSALFSMGFSGLAVFECRVQGADPVAAYAQSVDFVRRVAANAGLALSARGVA